jgi:single-strand DNA-binding protein
VFDSMQLLGGREGMGAGGGDEGGGGGYSRGEERSAAPAKPAPGKPAAKSATGFDDMDDDIPF